MRKDKTLLFRKESENFVWECYLEGLIVKLKDKKSYAEYIYELNPKEEKKSNVEKIIGFGKFLEFIVPIYKDTPKFKEFNQITMDFTKSLLNFLT